MELVRNKMLIKKKVPKKKRTRGPEERQTQPGTRAMKITQGGTAQGSRQSISLLNKSQNVSHHNISSQEPSILVSTGQRARSTNKSAQG